MRLQNLDCKFKFNNIKEYNKNIIYFSAILILISVASVSVFK